MRRAAVLGLLVAALAAPGAHAASWTALFSEEAHFGTTSPSGGSLGAIDLGSNPLTGSSPISVPNPFDIAIAPDANTAYVGSAEGCDQSTANEVQPVDLHFSPPVAGTPIALGAVGAFGLVSSPDGKTLYASGCGKLVPIDVATSTVGTPIDIGADAFELVISRDGKTLWAANHGGGTVSVVDLSATTPTVVKTITVGQQPLGMALTLDGAKLYVANGKDCTISVIDTATETAEATPIALPAAACSATPQGFFGDPGRLVLSPDGATLYAASFDKQVVTPIHTATGAPGAPIDFSGVASSTGGFRPGGMAFTPDGARLLVADAGSSGPSGPFGHSVQIVSTPANTLSGAPIDLQSPLGFGIDAAVTPDQAPVADFTATRASLGVASSFDASASTVRFGAIASYAWDFGDGTPVQTTTTAQTTHMYAAAGRYAATVTETSAAGASLPATTLTTGRTLVRRGDDSARAGKPVVVTTNPEPTASLSGGALDFGAQDIGSTSAAKTVTVTNSGSAALTISSIAASGDFAVSGCETHTLAVGASCGLAVTFTPTAAGARTGTLTLTDDAADSPQTVALTGTGDTTGTVTGTVRDATAPLPSAYVTLCTITLNSCQGTSTDTTGQYRFATLKPGSYIASIYPPSGSTLGEGTRLADVIAGQTVDATTVLRKPSTLPPALQVTTPAGPLSTYLYWDSPFSVDVPLKPLGNGPANGQVGTTVFVTLTTTGSYQLVAGSAFTYVVSYDGDGKPAHTTVTDAPLPGAVPDGFTFTFAGRATRADTVSAPDATAVAGAGHLVASSDGLHRKAHGALTLSVFGVRSPNDQHRGEFCDGQNDEVSRLGELMLLDQQKLASVTQEIEADKSRDQAVAPSLILEQERVRQQLAKDSADYDQELRLAEVFCPPPPCDDNIFNDEIGCPGGGPVAVDPSGFVRTKRGVPLEEAKVVLQRSGAAKGPFAALANGDGHMAPNNRRNPDRTDIDGHFGWDVFPGFYRVRATRKGCKGSALTKGLPVPPPVTNLKLKLSCPGLHRAKSHTRVLRLRKRKITVTVRGRGTPTGLVRAAGRFAFLRHGRATIVVPSHRKHVVARYAGNARWAPSHS